MSAAVQLAWHQFRFDQKTFWRNPAAVFFTVMLPVIFMLIFNLIFGNEDIDELGINTSTYYVPAIVTLGVISATMQSLAVSLTVDRENGVLKRGRGTPLPSWVVTAIGALLWGVDVPWDRLPAVFVTLAIGAAAFCCLGVAITAAIPSEDAAAPITNFAVLPLYFLSGVFIPETEIPDGVLNVADAFPVRHFFQAFFSAFDPTTAGSGFEWGDLAIVAAWGALGLVLALRFFRWTPRYR
jgi:ABC-2 type transport system permease protein